MDRAPVSVVIPAHNIESYVGDAIRSVLAQTLPVAEIIVVADDCSDQTPQVAEDLGATVLRLERGNISAARNLGIRASTQPWIAFLDADDFWEEDKIGFQWRAIKAWPSAAMISCDFFTVSNDKVTSPSERYLRERWNKLKTTAISGYCRYLEKIEGEFLSRVFLAVPTVMLRRDVFSGVGFFDENLIYGQALEFFARVLAQYPLAFVERPLVYQRVHASNHTRNVKGSWISYISVVDQMLKNPNLYPEGAGEAYRARLKRDFHHAERELARNT